MVHIPLSIEIINYYGKPAIQLRKIIKDKEKIALICDKALKEKKLLAEIKFNDPFKAAAKLKAAGLI